MIEVGLYEKRRRLYMRIAPILLALISCLLIVIPGVVHSTNKPITVVVNGAIKDIPFILEEGTTYVSLRALVKAFKGSLDWNPALQQIEIRTVYKQRMVIDVNKKRIQKEGLWRSIPLLFQDGHTYYPLKQLTGLFGKQIEWDGRNREIYIFDQVRLDPSKSVAKMIAHHGFELEGNNVNYNNNGTIISLHIDGKIRDISLLEETSIGEIVEKKYALFWQLKNQLAHILFTVRELPDGNKIFFTEGYSPIQTTVRQEVRFENEGMRDQFHFGNIFMFQNRGDMRELNNVLPSNSRFEETLKAGRSVGWFFAQSQESLKLEQQDHRTAWSNSLTKHRSIWWLTPQGANRQVPEPYLVEWENGLYFYNLQASTPQLLMDVYKQTPHPLYKLMIDNAAFTLIKEQGQDGFWRTEPNVAYLNRAFGLGEKFIDTRMSADASIFLLDYYQLFGNEEAKSKAMNFTRYFSLHDQLGTYYQLGTGRMYPDYYSEIQHGKPLTSLNHVLHEVNYLLLLSDAQKDHETKNNKVLEHAKWMLDAISHLAENWINADGDLYYALNNRGQYYARDYLYITYRDLVATKSFLLRERLHYPSIDRLLQQKYEYLQLQPYSIHYETDLSFDRIYETFDLAQTDTGTSFLATQVNLQPQGGFSHYAVGAFHWVLGAQQITWEDYHLALDSSQKYIVVDLKDQLLIMNSYPEEVGIDENGNRYIVNGDQPNLITMLSHKGKVVLSLEPGEQVSIDSN
jgi:hypothetical protein